MQVKGPNLLSKSFLFAIQTSILTSNLLSESSLFAIEFRQAFCDFHTFVSDFRFISMASEFNQFSFGSGDFQLQMEGLGLVYLNSD